MNDIQTGPAKMLDRGKAHLRLERVQDYKTQPETSDHV